METPANTPSATPVRHGSLAGLRIKWDRTIVFLTGVLLLVVAMVTALVAPFTAVTWAVPLVLLLLGAGCVAGLRYLAVTDRGQRVAAGPVVRGTAHAQHSIFDHEDGARRDHAAQEHGSTAAPELPAQVETPGTTPVRPAAAEPGYSVAELRAMALQVARGSGSEGSSAATWEPVPVPKPLYSQAPVVPRREPEPLQVPTRPAAKSASLKDAVRVGERESAAMNLDDVLKRRRA
ncbi:hypothetical protein C1C97_004520 [Kocuria tytonis]|uniref:Uncharacterized protein n=2 Tax=Kocuria tytonis TaxID=2054280 RepID=A0A495AC86_9MICC|nr:hypothetical protein C1C97_004520 [Kocuria tytonis]